MCNCQETSATEAGGSGAQAVADTAAPVITPEVPIAGRVTIDEAEPGAVGPPLPPAFPRLKLCGRVLRGGCYAMTFRPTFSLVSFEGTLRVDRAAPDAGPDNIIVSGDLYKKPLILPPDPNPSAGPAQPGQDQPTVPTSVAAAASTPTGDLVLPPLPFFPSIPIFRRDRYHSYLRVTSLTAPFAVPTRQPCTATLVVEQFDYTQPPTGIFKGSFPATPSRTVTINLTQITTLPFGGPRFEGSWIQDGVDRGVVTLTWVSNFFRRATVEIDTLTGAVAPQPVPDGTGGTEFFDTIYARAGWQLSVVTDQTNMPVPAGVTPTNCWSSGNLHNLMATNRNPATNLDAEWRIHLVVVPAKLGCSRGVMYDSIDVPREGCASFSDDGYPTGDSSNFGVAANQKQRDIARAYLRSATHEITHTFNQIHQEIETTADNSIMTTTPSVADVLGGPTTGAPGVFPDQINLGMNNTVRNHLVHMPDPVIRPGGWPFNSWFGSGVPQAGDRHQFDPSELKLTVTGPADAVVLGQPFDLSWTLTNSGGGALIVPNDVSLEGLFTSMWITDPDGRQRPFRPYVIICDTVKLAELTPGASLAATHQAFWSSDGFAFPRPGHYRVRAAVNWSAGGIPVGVQDEIEVFIDFPVSAEDNDGAGLVMNTAVGKWVALGGEAYHLDEACRRLGTVASGADESAPRQLAGFEGLLPDPDRVDPDAEDDAPAAESPQPRSRSRKPRTK